MSSPTNSNSSITTVPEAVLGPIGYHAHSCGYCKSKAERRSSGRGSSGSPSYYASSKHLIPRFYEDLICRGWRRSGTLLYKPDLRNACCPHYTLRLDAPEFRATKDQRQAQNRFNHYILGDEYIKETARLHPKSKAEAARYKQTFDLRERVHESELSSLQGPTKPAHDFTVTLEPDTFTEEKYLLYENYQRIVHKEGPDDIARHGFRNFLCSSKIKRSTETVDGKEKKLGSYHQCYRLDGRLVAIGVLDLLPNAVSAVYFMYHEDLHTWSPGKLSALRETALAIEQGCRWYMMGFYIHGCTKMKYKADYHPQYILDPEKYTWDLLDDDLKLRMDARRYVSLSSEKARGIPAPTKEEAEAAAASRSPPPTNDDDDLNPLSQNMPGALTAHELATFDLGSLLRPYGRGAVIRFRDIEGWEGYPVPGDGRTDGEPVIKQALGDLVAVVGMELAGRLVVDFAQR
ncbi:Arginyl-tRNA--protein transferase 1 [Pseudogymnoascus destructans]|uniref:Arginyl-tRNA--protein transferase 1 n=1 Tax=Pseudogymnoascus destructans TaxID=655981 RepID=A0A177AEE7_9PEZI|nr:Arginyl-tRNA--protein transferase 1 [Pseudogymnoascus destructans]OAF59544.1 Arginyl-tRNA--protein transferase 1 [Pseudogymnoascus destructans]